MEIICLHECKLKEVNSLFQIRPGAVWFAARAIGNKVIDLWGIDGCWGRTAGEVERVSLAQPWLLLLAA